jgi:hypothetical protein
LVATFPTPRLPGKIISMLLLLDHHGR